MKRIGLSILGGVAVPSLYIGLYSVLVQIASFVFHLWKSPGARRLAESLEPVVLAPIAWPSWIYFHFFPPHDDFMGLSIFEPGNLLSLATGNVVLYAALTWLFLWSVRKGPRQTPQLAPAN